MYIYIYLCLIINLINLSLQSNSTPLMEVVMVVVEVVVVLAVWILHHGNQDKVTQVHFNTLHFFNVTLSVPYLLSCSSFSCSLLSFPPLHNVFPPFLKNYSYSVEFLVLSHSSPLPHHTNSRLHHMSVFPRRKR